MSDMKRSAKQGVAFAVFAAPALAVSACFAATGGAHGYASAALSLLAVLFFLLRGKFKTCMVLFFLFSVPYFALADSYAVFMLFAPEMLTMKSDAPPPPPAQTK